MDRVQKRADNEQGFVLVVALRVLVILSLIGIAGLNTSIFEQQISGNDWSAKRTFYQADGGSELAEQVVFENAVCASTKNGFANDDLIINGRVQVKDKIFAENNPANLVVDDGNREAVYYLDGTISDAEPHTNLLTRFTTQLNPGTGQQMVSGYEGLGAGSAGGGTSRLYTISSQHRGPRSSESLVTTRWRLDNFIIASAASSDCKY
jgi:Tfp pilus assembly protein PilX